MNETAVSQEHTELLQPDQSADSALLTREPLAPLQSYYRSQTFTATSGINPLITAAAPLFSIANKLQQSRDYADVNSLHEHLAHEIKAFETYAQNLECRSETILVARYALCALLDETIMNSPWGNETVWGKYKLLQLFQHETSADERFFVILQRLNEDPKLYLDILELLYLTLNLGFMGKYRHQDNGLMHHLALRNDLYHTIRMQRGEFEKSLSKAFTPLQTNINHHNKNFSAWRVWGVTGLLLISIYMGLNYLLKLTIAPVNNGLNQIIAQQVDK